MKKVLLLSVFGLISGCTVIPPTPGVYLQPPVVIGQPQYRYPVPVPCPRYNQSMQWDQYGRYLGTRTTC